MARIAIDLEGKDNVSRALQTATARLVDLNKQIDAIRSKGAVNITVAETRNLTRLTGEAGRLERALLGVGTTGTQSMSQLSSSVGGLQSIMGSLGLGGLSSLAAGGIVTGIGAAAVGIAKLTVELGRMGEVNREVGIRFEAFAGSADKAASMIRAMSAAAEGGVDDEELMRSATLLLSTDLVRTAQEMGSVTRSALLLGDASTSATSRIEAFTNAMMTGSSRALRQFGITTAEVDAKVKILRESTSGLSDEQIRANAIMEVAAQKAQQIADAGGQATTSTDKLKTAIGELADELGTLAAPGVGRIQTGISTEITGFTALIQAMQGEKSGFEGLIGFYQDRLEELRNLPPLDPRRLGIPIVIETLNQLQTAYGKLIAPTNNATAVIDAQARSFLGLANAAGQAVSKLTGLAGLSGGGAYGFFGPGGAINPPSQPLQQASIIPDWYKPRKDADYLAWQLQQNANRQKLAGEAFARSVEAAANKLKDGVADALSTTQQNVAGLAPEIAPGQPGYQLSRLLRAGPLGPGAEGPTEKIYQAEAIWTASLKGIESEWSKILNMTAEQATSLMQLIGQGDWETIRATPEFSRLIDWDRLVQMTKEPGAGQEAAQKLLEAAGLLQPAASDMQTTTKDLSTLKTTAAPMGQITNNITLSVQAGAVQVTTSSALDVANKVIDEIFKALTKAENSIGLPPRSFAPGAG